MPARAASEAFRGQMKQVDGKGELEVQLHLVAAGAVHGITEVMWSESQRQRTCLQPREGLARVVGDQCVLGFCQADRIIASDSFGCKYQKAVCVKGQANPSAKAAAPRKGSAHS